jgi:hypothetical protein
MKQRAAAHARLRRLWPDRNPLRRTCDRAEAAMVAGLLAAFLIGGLLAGLFAGRWAYSAGLRAERAQQGSRHRVAAVLLVSAPAAAQSWDGGVAWRMVRARWVGRAGVRRTGDVPAPAGAQAGSRVLVWTSTSGRLTGPPLRHEQVAAQAAFASVLVVAGLGLALCGCGMLSRRALDRRRLAAWDADWRVTGPRWTSRC